jgi:dienelactone hydrolase
MRHLIFTSMVLALIGGSASAAMIERRVGYEIDGKAFEGVLVYDDSVTAKRPAVLMEPDWSGVSTHSVELAREIAGRDYVVFVADLFGVGYAPKDAKERATATTAIHGDINVMRARGGKGLDVMLTEGERLGIVDPTKIAGIGFCFGGGVLLEVAREGRDFKALTVFHVTNPQPADPAGPSKIKSPVLVLHGADDPITPRKAISALEDELDAAKVRWQAVLFSGTVHAFTDTSAPVTGASAAVTRYDPVVAKRSHEMMREFFAGTLWRAGESRRECESIAALSRNPPWVKSAVLTPTRVLPLDLHPATIVEQN